MNEIKIGDVTVTRVEEMHGPIMPTGAFFPDMPAEAWQEHRELSSTSARSSRGSTGNPLPAS
jgi:hypothetical protein